MPTLRPIAGPPVAREGTSTTGPPWSLALFPAVARWTTSISDASDPGSAGGLDVFPEELPAYELSTLTGYEEDPVGRVDWQRARYETYRGAQIVRRHYRDVLRERGWRIISNDPVRDGAALITASRGTTEVTVRITPQDVGVEIFVTRTETPTASRTPEPDPSPEASPRDATSAPRGRPR